MLRGINVGRAKRVAMGDLRALTEHLGYAPVRTVLNSGNVVFGVPKGIRGDHAARIEAAIAATLGISSRVIVLGADELATAAATNPLSKVAADPSRMMVLVLADPSVGAALKPLLTQAWSPEALAISGRFAYLWCPSGGIKSPLVAAVNRIVLDRGTMRNIATMRRLHEAARACRAEQEIA